MNEDKDRWVERIMSSHEGMRRATPRPDLFDSIMEGIDAAQPPSVSIVSMRQWVIGIAAAVVLLVLNSAVVFTSFATDSSSLGEADTREYAYSEFFMRDYNIYDYE